MKKIINTLKDGTRYAKRIVMLMLLSVIVSVGLVAAFIVMHQMLFFFGAVAGVFIAFSLKLTLDIYEMTGPHEDEVKTRSKKSKQDEEVSEEEEPYDPYGDLPDQVEEQDNAKPKRRKLQDAAQEETQNDDERRRNRQDVTEDADENSEMWSEINDRFAEYDYDDDDYGDEEADKPAKKKRKKAKKQKIKKPKAAKVKIKMPRRRAEGMAADGSSAIAEAVADVRSIMEEAGQEKPQYETSAERQRMTEDDEQEMKKLIVFKPASDEEIESYDKKKIKRTLHEYKVKRDNRRVLVDRSDKYKIKQTPAYIWVAGKEFHMLLIEEEPRHVIIPLHSIREISYLKKQPVNADTDYPAFHKKNLFTDLFRPCLPDYTYNTVVADMNSYKNLYGILGDIYFTNNSAKHLFDLLNVKFRVDDKVTMSPKVNFFFKDAYKANILLRDGVIDANGYADRISDTLDSMARSSIGFNEFKETLDLMIRNKLITTEFANHYIDVREKYKLG
ncbi:MAG: hypothetical protein NC311_11420 [Muribaculaceae bacterium]|nr:hypothetical protein [Muribaculaceae bacterium]MCM1399986.1 hypothetical protein [Clostridium sp.]MCM1460272.1 hypothetical protein [Bacteroides sp.]